MTEWVRQARRLWAEIKVDHLSLLTAAVAFYGVLAIFPTLIATITVYGLFADPDRIAEQIASATAAMPQGAADLILEQLRSVAAADRRGLTLGLVISLTATIWAAAGGIRALLTSLSVIFRATESRSPRQRALLSLAFTLGALVVVAVALTLIAAFPMILRWLGAGPSTQAVAEIARWLVLIALVLIGLAVLYRWGPNRPGATWHWLTWGTLVALAIWTVSSFGFSVYVANFSSYHATYGSIAAVIVLMLWIYLSAFAVLVGAEIDAIRERDKAVTHTTPSVR